jgi:hypothetical protein
MTMRTCKGAQARLHVLIAIQPRLTLMKRVLLCSLLQSRVAGRGEFASARREMAQIPGLDLVQPSGLVGSKRGEVLVD